MRGLQLGCVAARLSMARQLLCKHATLVGAASAGAKEVAFPAQREVTLSCLELAAQAVDNDVQVQLAHALDHGLVGLLVAREVEAARQPATGGHTASRRKRKFQRPLLLRTRVSSSCARF